MPASHHSVFYRPEALRSCRLTNSVRALKATALAEAKEELLRISRGGFHLILKEVHNWNIGGLMTVKTAGADNVWLIRRDQTTEIWRLIRCENITG